MVNQVWYLNGKGRGVSHYALRSWNIVDVLFIQKEEEEEEEDIYINWPRANSNGFETTAYTLGLALLLHMQSFPI